MKIRQFELARQHSLLRASFDLAWQRVLASNQFVLGAEVAAFERELATYLGGGHVVGVNSGSDALLLALRLMGVGSGDEVAMPTYTFAATLEAVLRSGARPMFVDCGARGFNCDPEAIVASLTAKTRALIVVHLFGLPVDLSRIVPICRARGIALIEDAAQALGAATAMGKAGTLGDVGCFSFYPTKNLGALGDGGAIWVADAARSERLQRLRNHGHDAERIVRECGVNSRLDELQAAMLRIKLPFLDTWIAARRRLAERYRARLRDTGFLPEEAADPEHAFNQLSILHPQRDQLRSRLLQAGVETRVFYERPAHLHPSLTESNACPTAEWRSREALALPLYPEMELADVDRVCDSIGAVL
jgi:dTDP-4-amino-4,6-dideoxygalactose transaminase